MATNYPGSLDNFTNPTSTNTLDSPSHSLQHSDLNDAVEAIETKLGAGAATPGTATALFPLVAGTAGATSWTQLTAAGISSGTATSGQVLRADGSGAAAWATPTPGGLVLISTTSYSAVSSQPINDVFSATYDNYAIVFTNSNSNNVMLNLRFRVAGADNTAATYAYQHLTVDGTTVTGTRSLSQTSINVYNQTSTSYVTGIIDVFSPNLAAQTQLKIRSAMYGNSTDGAFYHVSSTQFTGFSLYPTTNTMTGTVSVYGYAK